MKPGKARRLALAALPLILFVGMGGMFLYALESGRDPQALPSALQGRPAPATALTSRARRCASCSSTSPLRGCR